MHVVATGKDAAIFEAAEALAGELVAAGLTVLYDDRPKVSPGREVQGRRAARDADDRDRRAAGWPTASIEVRDRATGEREEVPVAEAAARVLAAVRG